VSKEREIISKARTSIANLYLTSDNILEIRFIEEYVVEPDDIKEIRKALREISENPVDRILVVPGIHGSISKEARDFDMFDGEPKQEKLMVAIVTGQLHQRILGTMYFRYVQRKKYQSKFFKKEKEAMEWLQNG